MQNKRNGILFILLLLILASCSHKKFESLIVPENNYKLSTVKDLNNPRYLEKIDSLYNSGVAGFFNGKENVKIFYKYFLQNPTANEKGAILISDGRTEAVVKYKEMIYDLYNNGYSVYIHDHRGQGFSGRMIEERDMGYVDSFPNFIDDMKTFYDSVLMRVAHKNIFLLAHSMGGAIGVTYLEKYPNDFKAAAFSSPMLGLSFPTCELIGILTGEKPEYAMGHTDYEHGIELFDENTITNCETRYNIMLKIFEDNPKARLGGASYHWVNESCKAFNYIFDNYKKIKTPLILFSGEEEVIVDPSAHNKFIELLTENGQNAKGYFVKNSKHEMFIEKDEVRIPVLNKILDFYNSFGQGVR